MRIRRVLEYDGGTAWMDSTLRAGAVQLDKPMMCGGKVGQVKASITEASRTDLTRTLRPSTIEHLEWSWNYHIAEEFLVNTTKDNARSIAYGLKRGEDVSEGELIANFLEHRVLDLETMAPGDPYWCPDNPLWRGVIEDVKSHPAFSELMIAEADRRAKEQGEADDNIAATSQG